MLTLGRKVAFGVAALFVVAALLVEGRSLVLFHSATPWSAPGRIHYCGRDYDRAGVVSAVAARDDGEGASFKRMTRGPLWQPIYGHRAVAPDGTTGGLPCTMTLYLRDGNGHRAYGISGGP